MAVSTRGVRLGFLAAGIAVALMWFLAGGSIVPLSEPTIVIEFGADPDTFVGATVEIDGAAAGALERHGQVTRSAFQVAKGDHTVKLVKPGFDSEPARVSLPLAAQKVMLLAEFTDVVRVSDRPTIVLRR